MRTKRIVSTVAAALILAGGVGAGTAVAAPAQPAAPTGACPDTGNEVNIPGGQAKWDITCEGGNVIVRGWVKDTRIGGTARVTATNGPRTQHADSPGLGKTKSFEFNLGPGRGASVRLSNV